MRLSLGSSGSSMLGLTVLSLRARQSACGGFEKLGVRTRETLGDVDPLNKVPFKRAISKVKKGPL